MWLSGGFPLHVASTYVLHFLIASRLDTNLFRYIIHLDEHLLDDYGFRIAPRVLPFNVGGRATSRITATAMVVLMLKEQYYTLFFLPGQSFMPMRIRMHD